MGSGQGQTPEDRSPPERSAPAAGSDDVYSQAVQDVERLRAEVEEKVLELDQALHRLERLEEPQGEPRAKPREPALRRGAPAPGPRPAVGKPADDKMMIEATGMAVAGSNRPEIEAMLRERYGIESPASLVDEILGPGG